jgi:hypothetical protein
VPAGTRIATDDEVSTPFAWVTVPDSQTRMTSLSREPPVPVAVPGCCDT